MSATRERIFTSSLPLPLLLINSLDLQRAKHFFKWYCAFTYKTLRRRNEYVAAVTEAEYQTMQTHSFLDKIYGGNVKNLVSTLLRQDILSADELKEIETFWRSENE